MFINRSDNKIKTQKIANQFSLPDKIQSNHVIDVHCRDLEIVNYPILAYLFGSMLIGVSIYLLYSVSGGDNSISGFNNQIWWQYILALMPMCFGIGFVAFCQIQKLYISRKHNIVAYQKTRLFCFITEQFKQSFHDLIGLSVIRTGIERKNINMVYYHIILSFTTCKEKEVLACLSESGIIEFFQEIRRYFDKSEISQKRIVIRNMVN